MFGMLIVAFAFACFVACSPLLLPILGELVVRGLVVSPGRPHSAIWRWLMRHPSILAMLLAVIPILTITLTWPCLRILVRSTIRQGTQATHEQAAQWYLHKLPREARSINYYMDYTGASADFTISETDFLEWCAEQGWSPEEIRAGEFDSPVRIYYRGKPPHEADMEFTSGLYCDQPDHQRGSGAQIIYDRDAGKAYYTYGAW